MVNRSFDKIRQAGRSMPAVAIRLMESFGRILGHTTTSEQRDAILRQADMVMRASEEAVPEPNDVADVRVRYDRLAAAGRAHVTHESDPPHGTFTEPSRGHRWRPTGCPGRLVAFWQTAVTHPRPAPSSPRT